MLYVSKGWISGLSDSVQQHGRGGGAPVLQGASDDHGPVHARKVLQCDAAAVLHSALPAGTTGVNVMTDVCTKRPNLVEAQVLLGRAPGGGHRPRRRVQSVLLRGVRQRRRKGFRWLWRRLANVKRGSIAVKFSKTHLTHAIIFPVVSPRLV